MTTTNMPNYMDLLRGAPTAVGVAEDNSIPDAQIADALKRLPLLTQDENVGDGTEMERIKTMRDDGIAFGRALAKASDFQKATATSAVNTVNARSPEIERAAMVARSSAPADPDSAEARYRAETLASILADVAAKKNEKAGDVAGKALAAATAFDRDIKRLVVRFSYARRPVAADLRAQLAFEQLKAQISGAGIAKAFDHYSALLALEDEAQLDEWEAATAEWVQEVARMPTPKLIALIPGGVNANDLAGKTDEISFKARSLARLYERRAQARMPQAIAQAQQIQTDFLLPAYRAICGTSAWDLTRDEAYRMRETDGARPFNMWDVRPGWHMRLVTGRSQKPTLLP